MKHKMTLGPCEVCPDCDGHKRVVCSCVPRNVDNVAEMVGAVGCPECGGDGDHWCPTCMGNGAIPRKVACTCDENCDEPCRACNRPTVLAARVTPEMRAAVLAELRERTLDAAHTTKGTTCPCCGRKFKVYSRGINSGMAQILIWLARNYAVGEWVHTRRDAPRFVLEKNEIGKLAYWGMVETQINADGKKNKSGIWCVTQRGVDFVMKRTREKSHAYLLKGKVIGYKDELVTIEDALGKEFNYAEMMVEPIPPRV